MRGIKEIHRSINLFLTWNRGTKQLWGEARMIRDKLDRSAVFLIYIYISESIKRRVLGQDRSGKEQDRSKKQQWWIATRQEHGLTWELPSFSLPQEKEWHETCMIGQNCVIEGCRRPRSGCLRQKCDCGHVHFLLVTWLAQGTQLDRGHTKISCGAQLHSKADPDTPFLNAATVFPHRLKSSPSCSLVSSHVWRDGATTLLPSFGMGPIRLWRSVGSLFPPLMCLVLLFLISQHLETEENNANIPFEFTPENWQKAQVIFLPRPLLLALTNWRKSWANILRTISALLLSPFLI